MLDDYLSPINFIIYLNGIVRSIQNVLLTDWAISNDWDFFKFDFISEYMCIRTDAIKNTL